MNQDYIAYARVIDFGFGTSSQGTFQMAISFELHKDSHPDLPERIAGYLFFENSKSEEISEKALLAMGWNPTINNWDLSALNNARSIIDAEVQLVLCEEEYNGKTRWKVRWINSRDGGMLKNAATADQVADFTKKLQARLMKRPAGSAPPRAAGRTPPPRQAPPSRATQPAQTTSIDDDDIPF